MRQFFNKPVLEARDIFDPSKPFVFLGGTIGSSWRAKLVEKLEVEFFDPIVSDWQPEDRANEEEAKRRATVLLYTITPRQVGYFTIAEMTHAVFEVSRDLSKRVCLLFLDEDDGVTYVEHQRDSVRAIQELLASPARVRQFFSIDEAAAWINAELKSEASRGD